MTVMILLLVLAVIAGIFILAIVGFGMGALGIGALTSSAFVKNNSLRKILMIGFADLILIGYLISTPFLLIWKPQFPILIVSSIASIILILSSVYVFYTSNNLENKKGRIASLIVFTIVVAIGIISGAICVFGIFSF